MRQEIGDRGKRNIVITGGAGFIGSNFDVSLLQKISSTKRSSCNYAVNLNNKEQSTKE